MSSKLVWAFAVVVLVAGCSKDKNGGVPVNPTTVVEGQLQTEACDYAPGEGDAASAAISDDKFVSTAFEKEYRGNWLDDISSTSIIDTSRKILQVARVELYQAADKGPSQCRSFAFLPTMPRDLDTYWTGVLKEAEDPDGRSFIAGIYIPQNTQSSIATNRTKSQIILRRNQSRWTLVHEFMHHNFHHRAEELDKSYTPQDGGRLRQLQNTIRFSEFEQARRTRNQETLTKILDEQGALIAEFFENFDARYVDSTFEEVAIESELRKRYDDETLKFVPANSYRNAAWYIESSADNAKTFYTQALIPALTQFYTEAQTLGHPITARLAAIYATLQQHVRDAERLKREHPLSMVDRLALVKELEDSQGDADRSAILQGSSPCGHDDQKESWEIMQSVLDQLAG